MMTPEMLAAGWRVLRRGHRPVQFLGPGPALAEAYAAMRALEPPSHDVSPRLITLQEVDQ